MRPRKLRLMYSEHAGEGGRDLLGQAGRRRGLGSSGLGGAYVAAVAAFDLAEAAHDRGRAARGAAVEVGRPAVDGLTAGADQDLPLRAYAALPRARATDRVGLPRPASIAGHGPLQG